MTRQERKKRKALKRLKRKKVLQKKANIQRNNVKKDKGLTLISDRYVNDILPKAKRGVMNIQTGEVRDWDELSDKEKKEMIEQESRLPEIYNSCPTMIHEKDFVAHDCCICGARCSTIHNSNNAFPVEKPTSALSENGKDNPKRCCNKCDTEVVLPARIKSRKEGTFKEEWAKYDDGSIYYELAGKKPPKSSEDSKFSFSKLFKAS